MECLSAPRNLQYADWIPNNWRDGSNHSDPKAHAIATSWLFLPPAFRHRGDPPESLPMIIGEL